MRGHGRLPLDPDVAAELEAIERALSARPVDPEHAELSELALLLVAERPRLAPERATALDERVGATRARQGAGRARSGARRLPRAWAWSGGVGAVIALVVALVLANGGGPSGSGSVSGSARYRPATGAAHSSSGAVSPTAKASASAGVFSAPTSAAASAPASRASKPSSPAPRSAAPARTPAPTLAQASTPASGFGAVAPQSNGRQVIESGQLQLSTEPRRIDQVAEEAFRVIGQFGGIVQHSTVSAAAAGGYAEIQLSVPEQNLAQAMSALSTLAYARVVSLTDQSQDVTGSYDADRRALADARALRTSLLKQLQNAVTQAQIDSLTAQLHDAEASISSDQATLASLQHQVGYSSVQLTIDAGGAPGGPLAVGSGSSGGFTLSRAVRDAGHVLTVIAGVALIALAVLIPLGLVIALAAWIWLRLRRRAREQALDAA
jgi:uncharacterized membrane protein (Fun14 family)